MKRIWIWGFFFIAYGLFSVKTHAAEAVALAKNSAVESGYRAGCPGT